MGINPIFDGITSVLDRVLSFIPNPQEKAKARLEAEAQLISILANESSQQSEINKVEAASSNLFVAGWRPFIGWVGGITLAWFYIGYPMLSFLIPLGFPEVKIPSPNLPVDMMDLVYMLLGVGTMRSYDKMKGTSR
jgi:hypothetical protein